MGDTKRRLRLLRVALVTGLALGVSVPGSGANGDKDRDEDVEFDATAIFFEYNSTDKDLGIHVFFDAPGWEEVKILAPGGGEGERRRRGSRVIFEVENGGSLRRVGSTEVFTESAEPELCPEDDPDCSGPELQAAIDAFLAKFPEGTYEFEGETVDGEDLEGEAELSHDLPAPVVITDAAAGFPTISWIPGAGIEVVSYQVVAEMIVEGADGGEIEYVQSTDLPASITSIETSAAFAQTAEQFEEDGSLLELKVEVIAVGANGNKTISEEVIFEAP